MKNRASTLVRAASVGFLLSAVVAGCGDDEIDGQGGGAGSTTSDAASSGSGSTASSTTSSSGAPASTSASSGTSVGTGGDGSGGDGEGGGVGGAGGGGGSGCAEQPDPYEVGETSDACADLEADPDAPEFHVEFIDEPTETLDYDGTIAIDFAFPYVLAVRLADLEDFTVTESRCQLLAGDEEPTCSEGDVDISEVEAACSMRSSGRFGIDPSNVREGINTFDFTMTLRTGCAEVSDTFTLVVDYQPEG